MKKKEWKRKCRALERINSSLTASNDNLWADLQEWKRKCWVFEQVNANLEARLAGALDREERLRAWHRNAFGPKSEVVEREPEEPAVCQICGARDCLAGDRHMVGQVSFLHGHYRPDGGWCHGVMGYTEPEERVCLVSGRQYGKAEAARQWRALHLGNEERVCSGIAWDVCRRWMTLDTEEPFPCATMTGCVGDPSHQARIVTVFDPRADTRPCGALL
jgi:hypothetical protein